MSRILNVKFAMSRYAKFGVSEEWDWDNLDGHGLRFAFYGDKREYTTYTLGAVGPNSISNRPRKDGRGWVNAPTQEAYAFMFANASVISAHPMEPTPLVRLNSGDYLVDADLGWIFRVWAPATKFAEPTVEIVVAPETTNDRSADIVAHAERLAYQAAAHREWVAEVEKAQAKAAEEKAARKAKRDAAKARKAAREAAKV